MRVLELEIPIKIGRIQKAKAVEVTGWLLVMRDHAQYR